MVAGQRTPSQRGVSHRLVPTYGYPGAVVAVAFLWLSLTPSLLPRGPLFQGVVSGAAGALGYGLGVFAAWLAGYLMSREEPWPAPDRRWWLGLAGFFVVGTVVMLVLFGRWQSQIRDLMGVEHLSFVAYPLLILITAIVLVIFIALGRLWAGLVIRLTRLLNKVAPPRISAAVGASVVILVTILILNGVVARYSLAALNSVFAAANDETTATSEPPTTPLRSGGPESLVTWDSLGREGRTFVSHGPDVEQLTEFNGRPAVEPIRAFVGLGSGDDLRANAELAADELVRAGGLEREVVAVGATTGSGWTNQATVDSLEYMYNGDVAAVSMQYSYLPSWVSFLVDSERARQAGSALFEAVDARIRELPEGERPRLVVFGESLGSFGAEAAFGTVPTVAARTDGALLIGPTFNNTLWRDVTTNRDEGSPEWLPIYEDGRQVRYVADRSDLERPDAPWDGPRLVYLQYASDPITWWSPSLILNRPDWLGEPRGRDVIGATRWIPIVTFLQVSADMAVSLDVPDGHGHNYLSAIPVAWQAILEPPGWTDADTERLQPLLTRT